MVAPQSAIKAEARSCCKRDLSVCCSKGQLDQRVPVERPGEQRIGNIRTWTSAKEGQQAKEVDATAKAMVVA
eukprot:7391107-Prymnesium_polylepis.1